mmetsp:Transcript_128776/g.274843  ORF Transcript_128776/g.274843 Transcript_128776/m.274843 type:complete len:218 (+) Transcript_128776:274-927(+)
MAAHILAHNLAGVDVAPRRLFCAQRLSPLTVLAGLLNLSALPAELLQCQDLRLEFSHLLGLEQSLDPVELPHLGAVEIQELSPSVHAPILGLALLHRIVLYAHRHLGAAQAGLLRSTARLLLAALPGAWSPGPDFGVRSAPLNLLHFLRRILDFPLFLQLCLLLAVLPFLRRGQRAQPNLTVAPSESLPVGAEGALEEFSFQRHATSEVTGALEGRG